MITANEKLAIENLRLENIRAEKYYEENKALRAQSGRLLNLVEDLTRHCADWKSAAKVDHDWRNKMKDRLANLEAFVAAYDASKPSGLYGPRYASNDALTAYCRAEMLKTARAALEDKT